MPRVIRSAYIAPTSKRFGTRTTALEKVVEALASQSGNIVAPHGANAANALGLNQQFPICEVYLTSGRTRKFTLGCSKIMVKHAPPIDACFGHGSGLCRSSCLGKAGAYA